jgi:hypothetical protein
MYFPGKDSSRVLKDGFGVRKQVWGFNFIMGLQLAGQKNSTKRFMIDLYSGLGIRFRSISTVNKEFVYGHDSLSLPIDPNIPSIGQEADANGGFRVLPNLTMGFRVCYRL